MKLGSTRGSCPICRNSISCTGGLIRTTCFARSFTPVELRAAQSRCAYLPQDLPVVVSSAHLPLPLVSLAHLNLVVHLPVVSSSAHPHPRVVVSSTQTHLPVVSSADAHLPLVVSSAHLVVSSAHPHLVISSAHSHLVVSSAHPHLVVSSAHTHLPVVVSSAHPHVHLVVFSARAHLVRIERYSHICLGTFSRARGD
jgi:hypothetical protein